SQAVPVVRAGLVAHHRSIGEEQARVGVAWKCIRQRCPLSEGHARRGGHEDNEGDYDSENDFHAVPVHRMPPRAAVVTRGASRVEKTELLELEPREVAPATVFGLGLVCQLRWGDRK